MTIEINGIDEIFRKLGTVEALNTLRPPMQRGVFRIQAYMADYPPPPATSRYVRTGTLGRRWTTKIDEGMGGMVGIIGNNASYGPWVQSSAFQARVHQGRWQTDRDAVRDNEAEIIADFEREIQGGLDR
jgi:hypothetical protein